MGETTTNGVRISFGGDRVSTVDCKDNCTLLWKYSDPDPLNCTFFFVVLGLELRAYTFSLSTSPFL
jgi:hypothetical protein